MSSVWVTLGIVVGVAVVMALAFLGFVYATHREAVKRRRNGEEW